MVKKWKKMTISTKNEKKMRCHEKNEEKKWKHEKKLRSGQTDIMGMSICARPHPCTFCASVGV